MNFGRYKEDAQREPIAITSYGRTSGYFVSAQEYAELLPFGVRKMCQDRTTSSLATQRRIVRNLR